MNRALLDFDNQDNGKHSLIRKNYVRHSFNIFVAARDHVSSFHLNNKIELSWVRPTTSFSFFSLISRTIFCHSILFILSFASYFNILLIYLFCLPGSLVELNCTMKSKSPPFINSFESQYSELHFTLLISELLSTKCKLWLRISSLDFSVLEYVSINCRWDVEI